MSNTIKTGDTFHTGKGISKTKCHIVSLGVDGMQKIITYKFWSKSKQRWYFKTDYLNLFLIGFEYDWSWDKSKSKKSKTT